MAGFETRLICLSASGDDLAFGTNQRGGEVSVFGTLETYTGTGGVLGEWLDLRMTNAASPREELKYRMPSMPGLSLG